VHAGYSFGGGCGKAEAGKLVLGSGVGAVVGVGGNKRKRKKQRERERKNCVVLKTVKSRLTKVRNGQRNKEKAVNKKAQ